MNRRIAKILVYEALTEVALVRLEDGDYAVAEGPITTQGPYAWKGTDSDYEAAKRLFDRVHKATRAKL